MADLQMGAIESRFADIIWSNEPISSAELARRSEAELNWKKTTSFTVLKRLCDKGIFKNVKGTVTSIISRDEFYSMQSKNMLTRPSTARCPPFLPHFAPASDCHVRKLINSAA